MNHYLLLFALFCVLRCTLPDAEKPKLPTTRHRVIGIQPLSYDNHAMIDSLTGYVAAFYKCNVVLLPTIPLQDGFIDRSKGIRYSADSLLVYLKQSKPDSITHIAGITDQQIYITKRDETNKIKHPEWKYRVFGIFGYGYQPGVSCVVSTARLQHKDKSRTLARIRTIMLHEIGHNLGLSHCRHTGCLMEDAKETIRTYDNTPAELCASCAAKIK